MFPLLFVIGLIGVGGALLLKRPAVVTAPRAGSAQERAVNVLPSNFDTWIQVASPRQKEAVRQIAMYQIRAFGVPVPPADWPELLTDDPATWKLQFMAVDARYRERFHLPPGPPA
jgi:hypothetical protein